MPNSGILCSASFWRCDSPTRGKTDDPIYIRPARFASLAAPWKHGALLSLAHILYDHCPTTRVYMLCTAARNSDLFWWQKADLTSSYRHDCFASRKTLSATPLSNFYYEYICVYFACENTTGNHLKSPKLLAFFYRIYTLPNECIACVTAACLLSLSVSSFFILWDMCQIA